MAITRSDRGQSIRLFDSGKCPYQMKNIADDNPAVIEHLTKRLKEEPACSADPRDS